MGISNNTVDTTRIAADDPYTFSASVSQMCFPGKDISWRPSAVVLVPAEPYPFSYIGASIVHHPINAGFLITPSNRLPSVTLQEIFRLSPTGKDVPAQIFLIGPISKQVERTLNQYGFTTYRIGSADVFQTAAAAAYFRLVTIPPEGKTGKHHIMVASAARGAEALPAPYFSAHMGVPIIFIYDNEIPPATKWVMKQFSDRTFTLFGSEKTINPSIEHDIRSIVSDVDRIDGESPYEISVSFSKRELTKNKLGWDRNEEGVGNAFSFGTIQSWQKTMAGILFAHVGKHTPLLLIQPSSVPRTVGDYLLEMNPKKHTPPKPPFMHGFVLGNESDIPYGTQVDLEKHLILSANG